MREFKVCPRCNIDRPLDRFYSARPGKCKNCHTEWQKEYYRKHPEKRRRERLKYAAKRHGYKGYFLTGLQYQRMIAAQEGRCLICGTDKPGGSHNKLVVDHCHKTGVVRGLLCGRCNSGIGMLKDDPELVFAALRYLKGPDVSD